MTRRWEKKERGEEIFRLTEARGAKPFGFGVEEEEEEQEDEDEDEVDEEDEEGEVGCLKERDILLYF